MKPEVDYLQNMNFNSYSFEDKENLVKFQNKVVNQLHDPKNKTQTDTLELEFDTINVGGIAAWSYLKSVNDSLLAFTTFGAIGYSLRQEQDVYIEGLRLAMYNLIWASYEQTHSKVL